MKDHAGRGREGFGWDCPPFALTLKLMAHLSPSLVFAVMLLAEVGLFLASQQGDGLGPS